VFFFAIAFFFQGEVITVPSKAVNSAAYTRQLEGMVKTLKMRSNISRKVLVRLHDALTQSHVDALSQAREDKSSRFAEKQNQIAKLREEQAKERLLAGQMKAEAREAQIKQLLENEEKRVEEKRSRDAERAVRRQQRFVQLQTEREDKKKKARELWNQRYGIDESSQDDDGSSYSDEDFEQAHEAAAVGSDLISPKTRKHLKGSAKLLSSPRANNTNFVKRWAKPPPTPYQEAIAIGASYSASVGGEPGGTDRGGAVAASRSGYRDSTRAFKFLDDLQLGKVELGSLRTGRARQSSIARKYTGAAAAGGAVPSALTDRRHIRNKKPF